MKRAWTWILFGLVAADVIVLAAVTVSIICLGST
jgi:hypothetical protein